MEKFEHFNYDHWQKVYSVLREQNKLLPYRTESINDHELLNSYVTDIINHKTYNVTKVKKEWFRGWFYSALIESNGSHRMIQFENISCRNDSILANIESFKKTFIIVSK